MKYISRNAIILTITLMLASAGMTLGIRSFAAPTHSANGQGTFLVDDGNGGTARRSFSFSARQNADGTVSGQANLHSHEYTYDNGRQPYMVSIDITCMKVINNTAYFGGTPRKSNETDPVYLDSVFFIVQDNGEPGKNTDKISLAYFWDFDPALTGDPQACQNLPDTSVNGLNDSALMTIDQGNIQVR